MSIVIKKAGIFDSFQDLGRFGFQKLGINPNGAMDTTAVRTGNLLLGNIEGSAALEMNFPAPLLEFRRRISFVISGADFKPVLDGRPVENGSVLTAKRGSTLKFSRPGIGKRTYLAVKNGFRLEEWLSSASTNASVKKAGFRGRTLKKDDVVQFADPSELDTGAATGLRPLYSTSPLLRFVPGPGFADLTANSELALRTQPFYLSGDSDRMGFRLKGPRLQRLVSNETVTSAVTFGTIQLLPDGQLIILMADHQTSGGYPNIGTIITADLPLAGQLGPGNELTLEPCDIREAERQAGLLEKQFRFLKTALRLRFSSGKRVFGKDG